jgi:hypothetical protein
MHAVQLESISTHLTHNLSTCVVLRLELVCPTSPVAPMCLQIIADDVKCTHGCAVSDLSEEELFYFRARGITALAARQALVNSFGAEVTQKLKLPALVSRLQADTRTALSSVDFAAAAATSAQ